MEPDPPPQPMPRLSPKFRLIKGQEVEIEGEPATFERVLLPPSETPDSEIPAATEYLFLRMRDASAIRLSEIDLEALILNRGFRPSSERNLKRRLRPPPPKPRSWRAAHREFWCRAFDRAPVPYSAVALTRFRDDVLEAYADDAVAQSLFQKWRPSIGAIHKWTRDRGTRGMRATAVMDDQPGTWSRTFPATVEKALLRAIAWYWSVRSRSKRDAHTKMRSLLDRMNRLAAVRQPPTSALPIPSQATFYRRVRATEKFETWKAKYGLVAATQRFKGVMPGLEATRPNECIIIDSTTVDTHLVLDADTMLSIGRPTLTCAIDVYSRCIVGLVVTYEEPSLFTIMATLKAVLLPKTNLIESFKHELPTLPVALEPFGKPATVLVDNEWAQVGASFQDACEDALIDLHFAPVKNPQYKSKGERAFATLNTQLFHKLPGAVEYPKDVVRELGHDPSKTALITIAELEQKLITWLNAYHLEDHDGIGMPPIAAWRHGVHKHGIDIPEDPDFLDQTLGEVFTVSVTRQGVKLEGVVYHEPQTTTYLLERLGPLTRGHSRRRHGAVARTKAKRSPADLTVLHVWCEPDQAYVTLPATNANHLFGLSKSQFDLLRSYAKAHAMAFVTDKERAEARLALLRTLEKSLGKTRIAALRAGRRLLSGPTLTAVGSGIKIERTKARHDGGRQVEVPTVVGLRSGPARPDVGLRRGGRRGKARGEHTGKQRTASAGTVAAEAAVTKAKHAEAAGAPYFRADVSQIRPDTPASNDDVSPGPATAASASSMDDLLSTLMDENWSTQGPSTPAANESPDCTTSNDQHRPDVRTVSGRRVDE